MPVAQRGVALLIFVIVLVIGALGLFIGQLSATRIQLDHDKITDDSLARAKESLIGFAASVSLPASCSSPYCARPGDLPCPDTDNNGSSNSSGSVVGRLPWKSLGLDDLRDSSGERLWYAVSSKFANCSRTAPLNNDTIGTITVVDANGHTLFDSTTGNGVVAVIIAPGPPLTRQDTGLMQDRAAGGNVAQNYLDWAQGQDNAILVENSATGFILGPVIDYSSPSNPKTLSNDRILVITRDEIMSAIQRRVGGEVREAILQFYASKDYIPSPAAFNDADCVPAPPAQINSDCRSLAGNLEGRIPANPEDAWPGSASFLNGDNNNWFQRNGWRDDVLYGVTPRCIDGTENCDGSGASPQLDGIPRCAIVVVAGKMLPTQTRTPSNRTKPENYFEAENKLLGDGLFVTKSTVTQFNDTAIGFCPPNISP